MDYILLLAARLNILLTVALYPRGINLRAKTRSARVALIPRRVPFKQSWRFRGIDSCHASAIISAE